MIDESSSNLALNVRQLRSARQLSQAQLAELAGIPRPTLAHLESGSANPTLSVLMRLASALQVLIEELVAPPRDSARHYSADELPQRQRGPFWSARQMPAGSGYRANRSRWRAVHRDSPHRHRGTLLWAANPLTVGGHDYVLEEVVLVFRGDQQHVHDRVMEAVGVSVVTLAPVPD